MFGTRKVDLRLPETRKGLVTAMPKQTHGFSISGVQMKCQMAMDKGKLKLVDSDGQFIVKPSPEEYPNVAENEHATLILMDRIGFRVPPCGLLRLDDRHLIFCIGRYDRKFEDGTKLHQEDAMQALGISNADASQKYKAASYQRVLELTIQQGGMAVAAELLERLAFSYLVGNDDHHLKNISFLYDPVFKLTPCYDVLASSLYSSAMDAPMALPMLTNGEPEYYRTMGNGYYSGSDFVELGTTSGLFERAIQNRLHTLVRKAEKAAPSVIQASYMPNDMKQDYQNLVEHRVQLMLA
jgi:serine/threonine-protein kinase HipA